MIEYIPTIKRVSTTQQIEAARAAASADGEIAHAVPTHIIEKNGEVVGYWSINVVPTILAWHKSDLRSRDTLHMIGTLDSILSDRGVKEYITHLVPSSPYNETFPKLGFTKLGTSILYHKEI